MEWGLGALQFHSTLHEPPLVSSRVILCKKLDSYCNSSRVIELKSCVHRQAVSILIKDPFAILVTLIQRCVTVTRHYNCSTRRMVDEV